MDISQGSSTSVPNVERKQRFIAVLLVTIDLFKTGMMARAKSSEIV
jgi:hypothetical protein